MDGVICPEGNRAELRAQGHVLSLWGWAPRDPGELTRHPGGGWQVWAVEAVGVPLWGCQEPLGEG